jgi:hypothetical protein
MFLSARGLKSSYTSAAIPPLPPNRVSTPSAKCRSFSVTTMQSLASPVAATIISRGLRGRPRPANSAFGPSGPENHCSSCRRFFPDGFFENPAADLRDRQGRDKEILVCLIGHPGHEGIRWLGFRNVADDIGIDQIPAHSSTVRLGTTGRLTSRSAPTRGERLTDFRIPPFFGGSPEVARFTNSAEASGPLSARSWRRNGSVCDRRPHRQPQSAPCRAPPAGSENC